MSRRDKQNQLDSARAITTGTSVSTNSYKLPRAGSDPSIGRKMAVEVIATEDAAGDVVATSYTFNAIQADNAALTSNVEIVGSSGAIAGSAMTDGKVIPVPIRQGSLTKQYVGLQVVVAGGTNPTLAIDSYYGPEDEIPANTYFEKVEEADV